VLLEMPRTIIPIQILPMTTQFTWDAQRQHHRNHLGVGERRMVLIPRPLSRTILELFTTMSTHMYIQHLNPSNPLGRPSRT
jgi:hypothetical protein